MSLKERCPVLWFTNLGDERGKLVVIEGAEAIPFDIKRVFYIYDSDSTVVRGQHANRDSEFVLINVAGKSKVRITDGNEELIVELDKPMMGVYIPKMVWKDMYDFSEDSILLVLASTHYDGAEYIRNYDEYTSLSGLSGLKTCKDKEMSGIKKTQPVLSLCMPTNGVSEWVFPSLDGIYSQGIDESLFEVIVMDNGNDLQFREKIREYGKDHNNLKYYKTQKELFLSEPEAYKKASGELIKFVNHRYVMSEGSIQYLLDFVEQNRDEKPIVYFSQGFGKVGRDKKTYDSFGTFVQDLGVYSTWSGGMAVWKTDMDEISDVDEFNYLFPHTDILFNKRTEKKYIIDGKRLWVEQPQGNRPKGNYDLFYAFAIEFVNIIMNLFRDGDLSLDEFSSVKSDTLDFLTELYLEYIVRKEYCSYDLTGYKEKIRVFYSMRDIYKRIVPLLCKSVVRKFKRKIGKIQ